MQFWTFFNFLDSYDNGMGVFGLGDAHLLYKSTLAPVNDNDFQKLIHVGELRIIPFFI